jgi:hypothetical protein
MFALENAMLHVHTRRKRRVEPTWNELWKHGLQTGSNKLRGQIRGEICVPRRHRSIQYASMNGRQTFGVSLVPNFLMINCQRGQKHSHRTRSMRRWHIPWSAISSACRIMVYLLRWSESSIATNGRDPLKWRPDHIMSLKQLKSGI